MEKEADVCILCINKAEILARLRLQPCFHQSFDVVVCAESKLDVKAMIMPESINSFTQNVDASRSIVKDCVDGKYGEPETKRYADFFFECFSAFDLLDHNFCSSLSVTLSLLLVLEREVMYV